MIRERGQPWNKKLNDTFTEMCNKGYSQDNLMREFTITDPKSVEAKKSRLRKEGYKIDKDRDLRSQLF
jgi:hypothetical protein